MNSVSIEAIRTRLQEALSPSLLEVLDESHKHAGHAGRQGLAVGDVSHVRLRITAAALADKSRVEAHRTINQILKPDFDAGLHALAIELIRA